MWYTIKETFCGGTDMEKEIKIVLIPGEQMGEKRDCIRITCGDVVGWGTSLLAAIEDFDIGLMLNSKGE